MFATDSRCHVFYYATDAPAGAAETCVRQSETEILVAYDCVRFASKAGSLAANHFATITSDLEKLREIGVSTLWEGSKSIVFI